MLKRKQKPNQQNTHVTGQKKRKNSLSWTYTGHPVKWYSMYLNQKHITADFNQGQE